MSWYPFYLNPTAPKVGIEKAVAWQAKFGEERTRQILARIEGVGKEVGIAFKHGGKTGSTRDSHRLIQFAKTKGPEMQERVLAAIFRAYFEREQDITSHEVLTEAGVEGGLDAEEVRKMLESDQGGEVVDREVQAAMANIVSGVPNFTIQDQYEIRGAQDADGFRMIFERIKQLDG